MRIQEFHIVGPWFRAELSWRKFWVVNVGMKHCVSSGRVEDTFCFGRKRKERTITQRLFVIELAKADVDNPIGLYRFVPFPRALNLKRLCPVHHITRQECWTWDLVNCFYALTQSLIISFVCALRCEHTQRCGGKLNAWLYRTWFQVICSFISSPAATIARVHTCILGTTGVTSKPSNQFPRQRKCVLTPFLVDDTTRTPHTGSPRRKYTRTRISSHWHYHTLSEINHRTTQPELIADQT